MKDKNWISVDDELPFQKYKVLVQNGQKKHEATYYRKKWLVTYEFYKCGCEFLECDCDIQYKIFELHKVTHWYKCPVTYPKVPKKDFKKYLDRCERYKRQIYCYSFNCGTCDKRKGECRCDDYFSVCKNEKVACVRKKGEIKEKLMIPAVEILDDGVNIPIYGTNDYCFIEWKEDDTYEDALIRAQGDDRKYVFLYSSFHVWPSDLKKDDAEYDGWELRVYEIQCKNTEIKYFLISYFEIQEFSDICHCVCIPFNAINLIKFYKDVFGDLSYKFMNN